MLTRSMPADKVPSQACSPQAVPSRLARPGSSRAPESSVQGASERTSTTVVAARADRAAGDPVNTPMLR